MGLGDLLNLDYGFALDGGPVWDFGTAGYSLSGPELSTADLMADQFGMGPMRGNDYTLGVSGIDEQPMRPSVFEVDANGQQTPLGFRGPDGNVQTLGGFPVSANPFGINQSGGRSLRDLLSQLAKAGQSGAASGAGSGGGGNASFSMPRIESPVAERIGAVPVPKPETGALPAPTTPAEFRPMAVPDTARGGNEEIKRTLEALFRRGGR